MSPSEIVASFVECINRHDLDGICQLLAKDHMFIDGTGRSVSGRESMRRAWTAYFGMMPDYWVGAEDVLERGDLVVLCGRAGGTYSVDGALDSGNRWEVPAAWRAVVRSGRLSLWQIFADNEPLRQIMDRLRVRST